jgi:hypothetical protein
MRRWRGVMPGTRCGGGCSLGNECFAATAGETMDIDLLIFETASAVILAVVLLAMFRRR